MEAVEQVLEKIMSEPRPTTLVFNKADRVDEVFATGLRAEFPGSFVVSARTGEGFDGLRARLFGLASPPARDQSGDQPWSR